MSTRAALAAPFAFLLPLAAQFQLPVLVPGTAPWGYTENMELLGDVDGDGDVDVLAFTRQLNGYTRTSFRPLHNDGLGNLVAGTAVAIPANAATHVGAADVDGDGFLDVITNTWNQPAGTGLLVFRGLGGASWAAPMHVPLPGSASYLATGHANGDGIADLFVVFVNPGTFPATFAARWVFGGTALTFPLGPTLSFGNASFGVGAVLDLDGDGLTDFAANLVTYPTPTTLTQAVELYRTTAAGMVAYGTLPTVGHLIGADIDGDGDSDLLGWSSLTPTTFRLLRNDGASGFTALAPSSVAGPQVFGMRAVDWDGDGDKDLLGRDGGYSETWSSGPPGYGITLFENVAGTFTARRRDEFAENTMSLGAGAADLDGDGRQDYVEPHALVFGTGDFGPPNAGPAIAAPDDWDDDGDLDHVDSVLRVNDGRGVLTAVAGFWPPPPANHFYDVPVATADFDGDGLREVLAPLKLIWPLTFVEMRRLEANGDGLLVDVGSASTVQISAGALADDVDDDGDIDVLSGDLWRNDGTGAFTSVPFAIAGFWPGGKGDLDGDGDQDFVGNIGQQVAVVHRTAPGTYALMTLTVPPPLFVVGGAVHVADLDDDGDLDFAVKVYVVYPGPFVQHTVVFTNTGGTFVPGSAIPGHLMSGDMDGDGMTDLCVQDQNMLHVLRRIGPGAVYAPPVSYVWRHARRAADLDQDGDVDLLGEPTLWNRRFDGPSAGARRQYGTGGAGTGGRRPLLSLLGPLRTGLTTNARVVAAPGGSVGVLFVSTVEAYVPQALPGVTSWIGASFPALVGVFGGAAGQPGAGAVELPIAIPPGVNGARLFLQFLLLDPAMPIGLGYSNGCELFVGL